MYLNLFDLKAVRLAPNICVFYVYVCFGDVEVGIWLFNPLNVLFCLTETGIYLIPGAKQ